MIKAETEFTFHNVGEGLFYSANIKLSTSSFRFIYDCGSRQIKLIESAIIRFLHDIKNKEISLLILSHLHEDHVSGINELFSHFNIHDVILPYFSPIERLLIALRRLNLPNWYYQFLSDPVDFLIKKGAKRVIIIGGKKGGEGAIPPYEIPPSTENKSPSKINIERLPDDKNLEKLVRSNEENWEKYMSLGKLLIKSHNGFVIANGLWLFRFFNYKVGVQTLQTFERCLHGYRIDEKDLREVIRNKKSLKSLKECYNQIATSLNKDFNNTSLVVYHGPVGKVNAEHDIYCFPLGCLNFTYPYFDRFHENKFGQIFTGDISLKFRYNELINHFQNYLREVLIVQVPHHGARKNWNGNILNDFPNSKVWVVSAGCRNIYGHPSLHVIRDILFMRKRPLWVNELSYVQIRGFIKWQ